VTIEQTIRANSLSTVEQVANYTKAGGGCASCHEGIEEILSRVMAEAGETFSPAAIPVPAIAAKAAAKTETPKAAASGMAIMKRVKRIATIIESIRPQLQLDSGDIELVEVLGDTIYVTMSGACNGCQMAAQTLGGVQQRIVEELGEFVKVLPASELANATAGA